MSQEALPKNEQVFRALIEEMTYAILLTTQNGIITYANPFTEELFGYRVEELYGNNVLGIVHPEDQAEMSNLFEKLLEEPSEVTRKAFRYQQREGSWGWIEGTFHNCLANGQIRALMLTYQDITERKGAEERIQHNIAASLQLEEEHTQILKSEQEARAEAETAQAYLTTIFETITDGILVCDKTGRIIHTNAAMRERIGAMLESEGGPPPLDPSLPDWLIPRDIGGNILPFERWPLTRVLQGERLSGQNALDILFYNREGIPTFFNASGAPILDGQGQISGGLIALRDVTQRRHLEQRLQYSELKFRSLVEANILGVGVFNVKGRVLEVNDFLAQMLGYNKHELVAEDFHWQSLTPTELRHIERQAFEKLIASGVIRPMERSYLRRDGTRFPALVAATMIDQEEKVAMVVVLDISDRKAAEQRKQEFMSMVSHELRTPLTGIVGFIDLAQLLMRQLSERAIPEQEEQIEQINWMLQQAEQHAAVETRLVESLLDVARMERHIFKLSLKQWNLIEIVREVALAKKQIAGTRIIKLVLPERKQIPVIIDTDRIQQVIGNYFTNALKFAPEDREITIGLEMEETMARVYVQDHGPGLARIEQQRVWERFYQNDATGKYGGEKGGLGLGLYIAKILIEQHHGQVGVTSQPGEGATFWFTIPFVS